MESFAKTVFREIALRTPYIQDRYLEWEFRRREQSFRGIYPSFQAALLESPTGKLVGYNHKEIARIDEGRLESLNQADYPVLFWMAPLLAETRRVFDLGGNIGVAFYVYRHYLAFPTDLRWTVCEVPATADAGRDLAAEKGETQLIFTDDREVANDAGLYFTSGALQYIEESFAEILGRLRTRPKHLLINRVPLCDGEPFITLQNNGAWVVPYKIANEFAFLDSITALGYELIDHWRIHRSLQVLTSPEHKVDNYQGMYFRLRQAPGA